MKKIKLDEKKLEWITSKFVEFFEMDDSEYENVKKIVQNALKMKEPPSGSEIETVSTAETFKEAEDNFLHANNETEEKAGIRKCFELAETMGEVSIICEDIFPHLYPIDSFEATLAMRAMAEMFIKEGETVL